MASLRSSPVWLSLVASTSLLAQPLPMDIPVIFSNNEQATAFVTADGHLFNDTIDRMTGSGFFISDDGLLVTNNHVTFDNKDNYKEITVSVQIQSRTAPSLRATIEWTDRTNDLALLRLEPATPVRRVALGKSSTMKTGSRIAVMGFPLTSDLSVVDGLISSKPKPNRWQTSAPLNPGNSGGPVFNDQGEVIGVVRSGTTSATVPGVGEIDVDGINFFIPIDVLASGQSAETSGATAAAMAAVATIRGVSSKPVDAAKVKRLARAYPISEMKDDHSLSRFTPDRRPYSREFAAERGYRIVKARVDELSANFMNGLATTIAPDGRSVKVSFTLESGPNFNQYRGWLHASLLTEQVLAPPPATSTVGQ